MPKIIHKHSLATRWFHWLNFPILGIMIWSGLLIYWANGIYKIQFNSNVFFTFFPKTFYTALGVPYHLADGMAYHFLFMWLFFINGLLYVIYTIFSGEWKLLVPNKHSFKDAWEVLKHDLFITKNKPPVLKYNGAQRIAYTAIIIMGIGSLLSGMAIYKPVQTAWLTALFGGYETARAIHFILTIGYVLFFVIHIMQVVRTGWNNFRAMVTGFEVKK